MLISGCEPVIQPPVPLQNVLFCMFLSTYVVQKVCVCTMDFVSADKNTSLLSLVLHSTFALR